MDKIIKILNFVASGFFLITISFGYVAGHSVDYFVAHIYIALIAASLMLLGQVAIFFYLLATGASIRESAHLIDNGQDAVNQTKYFKKKTFPFAMLSILFIIGTTALGGAVHTRVVMPYVHSSVAWTCLCVTLFSTINAGKYFTKNKELILKVIEITPLRDKV